jgi:molybdopterin/thiamine biosynthesis adenylyltransferase
MNDRPQFLTTEAEVDALKAAHPELQYVDAYERQRKELAKIERGDKPHDFTHVYFPWNNTLVKTVGKEDYFTLKTNRNQDLITAAEQQKLRSFKVAVLGMSVGSNIAFVLTQAGISNEIVLADFDALDTTNLNRILAGVHEVGLNKTLVAARRIYEDNPFAEVTLMQDGVNEKNLEELLAAGKLDCIVEEIDDISFKIHARLLAMKYKVPVVMVTDNGDGVVLHVERYDLGHDLIWGKPHSYYEEKLAEGPMDKEKAGGIIMHDIVGGVHRVDPKMLASVKRTLAGELVSWSQLGSAAILGGVIANYAIKEIALGKGSKQDLRAWISPEQVEQGSHAAS